MSDDAKNVQAPHDVASALRYIGEAENQLGDHTAAIASLQRAMRLAKQPLDDRDDLGPSIVSLLANAYEGSGRLDDALRMRREALDQRRALLARQPGIRILRRQVVASQQSLAATLVQLTAREHAPGERRRLWHEARAAYEEGLRVSAGLDASGAVEPADASMRDRLRAGITRCDRALAGAPGEAHDRANWIIAWDRWTL